MNIPPLGDRPQLMAVISWITLIHVLIDSLRKLHSTWEVDQLIQLPAKIVQGIMLWPKDSQMPLYS